MAGYGGLCPNMAEYGGIMRPMIKPYNVTTAEQTDDVKV